MCVCVRQHPAGSPLSRTSCLRILTQKHPVAFPPFRRAATQSSRTTNDVSPLNRKQAISPGVTPSHRDVVTQACHCAIRPPREKRRVACDDPPPLVARKTSQVTLHSQAITRTFTTMTSSMSFRIVYLPTQNKRTKRMRQTPHVANTVAAAFVLHACMYGCRSATIIGLMQVVVGYLGCRYSAYIPHSRQRDSTVLRSCICTLPAR